jgi:hypothetical protein
MFCIKWKMFFVWIARLAMRSLEVELRKYCIEGKNGQEA